MATRKVSRRSKKGTRKMGKKMSSWTSFVKKIYSETKRKNPNVKLGDAMRAASKRKSEM